MGNAEHIGRYGPLLRTASAGGAVLMSIAVAFPASASDVPPRDKTALIMGTSTVPTPDDFWLETIANQFVARTHPGQKIESVAVTTPEEGWPLGGPLRLIGLALGHMYPFDVSLADVDAVSHQGTHGRASYYFFETQDLPLFGPLRTLGVPEALIDVVEPFFRAIVELGYDRTIPPWEPTVARLIPTHDPVTVAADLVEAIGEGIDNAFAPFSSPSLRRSPEPVTLAAPGTDTATADMSLQMTSAETPTHNEQVTSEGAVAGAQPMLTDMASATTTETENADADMSSQGFTAAATPEASADTATPRATKPIGRRAILRSAVRGSGEVGEQLRDRSHRGNGDVRLAWTAGVGRGSAKRGPAAAASSPAGSSSTGSNSSDGDSPGLDAGDS